MLGIGVDSTADKYQQRADRNDDLIFFHGCGKIGMGLRGCFHPPFRTLFAVFPFFVILPGFQERKNRYQGSDHLADGVYYFIPLHFFLLFFTRQFVSSLTVIIL